MYIGLAADYYFHGIFEKQGINLPSQRLVKRAFHALTELLQLCLAYTFNVDGRPTTTTMRRKATAMRVRAVRLLCIVELGTPKTFFAKYMHELLHVVSDCIPRWGSVRNFWSFFPER